LATSRSLVLPVRVDLVPVPSQVAGPVRVPATPGRRRWRVAVVTETWPPEVNGVASTVSALVGGLRERGHTVQVVRVRQPADAPDPAHGTAHDRNGGRLADDRAAPGQAAPCAVPEEATPASATPAARADAAGPGPVAGASPAAGGPLDVTMAGVPIPFYANLRMGLPCSQSLLRLWRDAAPDVVHIATQGPLGHSALRAASRLGIPTCSEYRTNFHSYSGHYGIGWLGHPILGYLRHFHNRTARTMVPTAALRGELAAAGFANLHVVARGVDTSRFDPARRSATLRARWGATPDTRVVLYVGRLAPEKNLPVLVRAFDAMAATDPSLRFVLVGDGPSRAELATRLPQAVFAGMRTGVDLAEHYASADCFVFPSLTETYGNVTPEAMASGLAVLAFDHAAAGLLIRDGVNGLLAARGDGEDFVRKARHLAGDRDTAAQYGRRARETACSHGWSRIVDQVEGIYAEITGAVVPPVAARRGQAART
jgi:glycosyltransferase involved in cell wall biosynthesis